MSEQAGYDSQPFDPVSIIGVLNEFAVRFVVVGGVAAGVQGAMWATTDLDVVYARSQDDHGRLASALADLQAEPIQLPNGVRVVLDRRALGAGDAWTLRTRFGRLDLLGEPAPGLTYETLAPRSRLIHGENTYAVASIDDLIAMKRAAGRPKDLAQIDLLRATREELAAYAVAGHTTERPSRRVRAPSPDQPVP